jgi:hypothetical protein
MHWQIFIAFLLFGNILTAGTLHLKTRIVDTKDLPADYQTGPARRWRDGASHYLLQFRAPVSDADRYALAERGAVITGTIPDNAVTVLAGDAFTTDGLDLEYAGRLRGWDKISPLVNGLADGAVFVVEFHPDVNVLDALQLLGQQNLAILPHPNLAANHFLVTGTLQEVLNLQDWDEIDYIFPASDDLVAGAAVHSCEGALSTAATGSGLSTGQYVIVGHGWPKDATGKVTIGYFFSGLTPNVPVQITKSAMESAFAQWAKYAPLQFQPASSATAAQTISVWFASGDHGDGFPFSSNVLAHTFYPSNPEPIAGDLHMNMDEPWHSGSNIDIFTVALHEAGHALGLGHSDQPGAIMYPYYRLGAQLSADDIAGIQSIYGPLVAAPVAPVNPLTLTIAPVSQTAAPTIPAMSGTTANGVGQTVVTWQTDHKASGRASGSASWSAAAVPLVTGSNTVTVTATDGNHRTATQSVTVTRSAPAPTATTTPTTTPTTTSPGTVQGPPSIAITSPATTIVQTNQPSITVTGSASATAAKVTWQNGPIGTGTAIGIVNWSAAVPLLTGTNNLIFKAFDAAGNSSWRSVTVVKR